MRTSNAVILFLLIGFVTGGCFSYICVTSYYEHQSSAEYEMGWMKGWQDRKDFVVILDSWKSYYAMHNKSCTIVGDIDNVLIYDRVLNESEIKQLYMHNDVENTVAKYGTCMILDWTGSDIEHISVVENASRYTTGMLRT